MVHDFWNKPCAASGLKSYRYQGAFGWVMIGATDDNDAMREVSRSLPGANDHSRLQVFDGDQYIPVVSSEIPVVK